MARSFLTHNMVSIHKNNESSLVIQRRQVELSIRGLEIRMSEARLKIADIKLKAIEFDNKIEKLEIEKDKIFHGVGTIETSIDLIQEEIELETKCLKSLEGQIENGDTRR